VVWCGLQVGLCICCLVVVGVVLSIFVGEGCGLQSGVVGPCCLVVQSAHLSSDWWFGRLLLFGCWECLFGCLVGCEAGMVFGGSGRYFGLMGVVFPTVFVD